MSENTDINKRYIENSYHLEIAKINSLLRKVNKLKKNIKNSKINFNITNLEEYKDFFQSLETISDEIDILSFKITGNKDINLESKINKYNKFKDLNNGLMSFMFLYQLGNLDKDYKFINCCDNKIFGYDFLNKYSKHLNENHIPQF